MKKILLVGLSLMVGASVMAQGTFSFKTKSGTTVDAKVTLTDRSGAPWNPLTPWAPDAAKVGWYCELLLSEGVAPTSLTGTSSVGTGAVREPFFTTTGYVNGKDWTLANLTGTHVFQLVAYYATTGSETYDTLKGNPNNIFGLGNAFEMKLGGGGTPPEPAALMAAAKAWTVAVPEPSVLALGVLGIGAFLLRRRS